MPAVGVCLVVNDCQADGVVFGLVDQVLPITVGDLTELTRAGQDITSDFVDGGFLNMQTLLWINRGGLTRAEAEDKAWEAWEQKLWDREIRAREEREKEKQK